MSRVEQVLSQLKQANQKAFVAYITAGDPDLDRTETYCKVLRDHGVDIIELGIPFSDPLADGPTNQLAAQRALASGTTLEGVLDRVEKMRGDGFQTPIVIFSYLNPIFQMGYAAFAQRCKEVGVDGALVLDLPPEEADRYIPCMESQGVDTVFLAAPTTAKDRLDLIVSRTRGFLYYVSRTGVTGVQQRVSDTLEEELRSLQASTSVPIIVGFGISNQQQAKDVAALADGMVIGSRIVQLIQQGKSDGETVAELRKFVSGISKALKGH